MDTGKEANDEASLNRRELVVGAAALTGAAAISPPANAMSHYPFSGIYAYQDFVDAMNKNYTTAAMPNSVMKLQQSPDPLDPSKTLDLATIKWGDYQTILTPADQWPRNTFSKWLASRNDARDSLTRQINTVRLSPDDSIVPATKVDLLDLAVRKCFNSKPPIQMIISVSKKKLIDPEPDKHDIALEWTTVGTDPTLKLTMVCPYG